MLKKLDLQLFADGDDAGAGADDQAENNGNGTGKDGVENNEPVSFDDFLKNGNQDEFDRRVAKAINTAVTNAKEKWDLENNEKLTEAERLAKMTKEEKALYKNKKLEEKIAEMEREKEIAGLTNEARNTLKDEGINCPDEILGNLVGKDAESTKKAVEAFAKMFNDAVGEAVKSKARGKTPTESGEGGSSKSTNLSEMAKKARIIK